MTDSLEKLAAEIIDEFGDGLGAAVSPRTRELSLELADASRLLELAQLLRDKFGFEMLIDLAGVDYLGYGVAEWKTESATITGYSRAVDVPQAVFEPPGKGRFAVVYHLLSINRNQRLRMRAFCPDDEQPIIDSLIGVWASADWYEREAFDLFGILFDGHPDLRRLLTDYGFIGHPFRKDFPLIGNVEVRYDPEKGRVIYQPVTIEPRTLVPKVIRDDNRYSGELTDRPTGTDTDA